MPCATVLNPRIIVVGFDCIDLTRQLPTLHHHIGIYSRQFLAVMRKHIGQEEFDLSAACGSGDGRHTLKTNCMANKVGEVFKQMDVRGDGDVSWEDFSAVRKIRQHVLCQRLLPRDIRPRAPFLQPTSHQCYIPLLRTLANKTTDAASVYIRASHDIFERLLNYSQ